MMTVRVWRQRLKRELERRCGQEWAGLARPEQRLPDGDWRIWLILAGRGFGKTRTGAETVLHWARAGTYRSMALVGATREEIHHVMVRGPSGILSCTHPRENLRYEVTDSVLTWPNGATARGLSAHAPESFRGPQFDAAWVDELAKFAYARQVWDQLMMALRLGTLPRVIITTTPRPIPLLKELLERRDVHVTRGTTFDNQANLAPGFLTMMQNTYAGTHWGAQEIYGEMIQAPSGLWTPGMIQRAGQAPLGLQRIVVAIDPATSSHGQSNETGIVVAGRNAAGRGYVLADLSGSMTPTQWMTAAVTGLRQFHADRVVAEVNNGGDLVRDLLFSLFPHTPYKAVHATRGKIARAEPIAALYEQGRIFHVGHFAQLEAQMLNPGGTASPDRLDALVWALTELFLTPQPSGQVPRIVGG